MIEAHDQGVYWSAADIEGLKNLLTKVLWNGSLVDPTFSGYFDGSAPGKGFFVSDGFVKLGRYDADIQRIFENYRGQEIEESYLTQYYGNAALNARLLGATDCAECRSCLFIAAREQRTCTMSDRILVSFLLHKLGPPRHAGDVYSLPTSWLGRLIKLRKRTVVCLCAP